MPLEYLTVEHLHTKDLIRIFSKIEVHPDVSFNGTPCWIWVAAFNGGGYGHVSLNSVLIDVHRIMFAWLVHPLPKGKENGTLDHLCRRRACSNPLHLEFVSDAENLLRGISPPALNARKTQCKRGHPLTGSNLCVRRATGYRQCVICRNMVRRKGYVPSDGARTA